MKNETFTSDNVNTENNGNSFTKSNVKDNETTANNEQITKDNVKTGREKSIETGTNNLIPLSERTKDEQKRIARQGGLKSGENRRKRKTAKQLLENILSQNLTDEQIEEILGNASALLDGDKSAYNVMMVKALQGAMGGDVKSQLFIRDTVGDAPVNKQELQATITDADKQLIDTVRNRLLS